MCSLDQACVLDESAVTQSSSGRGADVLFDKQWRERHRKGENDYSKNMIAEPFAQQAFRFVLRSVVGSLCGLGIHALVQRLRGKDDKTD
ncbi:CVA16-2 [Symbiodinium natans]|uniref:CVA16-2 protein n=1 Tax=Symbiodinium natans TaxID=878477 RepID=A0A812T2M4_9DINO|nr:CVA16-2 [Symbiodinium natans]